MQCCTMHKLLTRFPAPLTAQPGILCNTRHFITQIKAGFEIYKIYKTGVTLRKRGLYGWTQP